MANTGFFTLLIESLLLPPGLNLLLGLIAWGLWKSWPKTAKSLLTFSAVSLYLMSTPLMSAWLEAMLPQSKPLTMQQIEALKNDEIPTAIVLVSAGRRKGAEEYGLIETVNAETLEILRYGAFLQRKTGFPIMVVGGTPNGESTPEAVLMNQVLTDEFGAEVNWMEANTATTFNISNFLASVKNTKNFNRILLVTFPYTKHELKQDEQITVAYLTNIRTSPNTKRLSILPNHHNFSDFLNKLPL